MRLFSIITGIVIVALLLPAFSRKAYALTLQVTCRATTSSPFPTSPLTAVPNQTVRWNTDQVYCDGGGCTNFILSYGWTGENIPTQYNTPNTAYAYVTTSYPNTGRKQATIRVTDPSGASATNSCYIDVVAASAIPSVTPTPTHSPSSPTNTPTPPAGSTPATGLCGIGATDAATFASKLLGCGISLVGGTAMLFIIYGGFLLVLAAGDPSRIRKGKEYVTYAVVGLVVAVLALVILQVIGLDVLHLPGFSN